MIHTDGTATIAWADPTPERAEDFIVLNGGSVYTLRTISSACEEWIGEHVRGETTYFGGALVVEPRYIARLVEGLEAEGFLGRFER